MIALLGATGAVGRHVLRALPGEVRAGSRSSGVDVHDDRSLAEFVAGASVVVNCVGPSHQTAARVAEAAVNAGADHVDAGGADAVVDPRGQRVVFAAGASPGLSGLLPRWLGSRGTRLTMYCGVLDRFTTAGAEDYLNGVNEPLAAWRNGQVKRGALTRVSDVDIPFFDEPVSAFPFMDAENEAVARSLSLVDGDWYSVVEGKHLLRALGERKGLCEASALDLAGRSPRVTFVAELDGRTAVLRAGSVAELTAAMTVAATKAILRGDVPCGLHRAATVLEPFDGLDVTVFDAPLADLVVEEGAL
ncbi:hypothetical protein [Allokutzneria sp. NRRL B-24872]|uniref:hypothetical protein n=1 Tax=Allokutzneria sp. NRRL B-24872 TaxID=1137961 RepID=UPI000A3A2A97|nr:hypothetical protein [Allokutzneria sp. NRRL B-24872]